MVEVITQRNPVDRDILHNDFTNKPEFTSHDRISDDWGADLVQRLDQEAPRVCLQCAFLALAVKPLLELTCSMGVTLL